MSTVHSSASGVDSLQVSPFGCAVGSIFASNLTAGTLHLMIFDKAGAIPENDDTPDFPSIPLLSGQYYESDARRSFQKGCWLVLSTTPFNLTKATGADNRISADVV